MGLSSVPRSFLYIVMFIQLDCETVSGIEMENNAVINPVAGTFGVIYWTQMKKPITSDRLKLKNGSGERVRYHLKPAVLCINDLQILQFSKTLFEVALVYL